MPPPRQTVALSLHDALPIYRFLNRHLGLRLVGYVQLDEREVLAGVVAEGLAHLVEVAAGGDHAGENLRSEEHTSELQSLRHVVCRLLLERKTNSAANTATLY